VNPRLLLLALVGCGSGFVAGAGDDASTDVGTSADEHADVLAEDSAPPGSDATTDVRMLDGTGSDVTHSDAGAGDGSNEGASSLCCHIDCNGPRDLPCDAGGVLCYDAGCMFYMACAGNVEVCK
jgi:hypothetical protein